MLGAMWRRRTELNEKQQLLKADMADVASSSVSVGQLGDGLARLLCRTFQAEVYRHFNVISTSFQRHFNVISTSFQRHFKVISTSFQRHFNVISTSFQRHFNVISTSF
jgi:AraC-like DNA-binding protein